MNVADNIRDEELTAYLDGEADPGSIAAIDAALAQDYALRQRLDELRPLTNYLPSAFDPLLAAAPGMPSLAPQSRSFGGRMAAGLAACLLAGVIIGSQMSGRAKQGDWMDYVAAYQALYVNETLASVEQTDDMKSAQLARFSATLGRDLNGAGSDMVLDFRRSQLLGYEGQPLIQLAYLSPTGAPVALCIIKAEDTAYQEITVARLEGMSAAYWTEGGHAFLLIGGQDDALIEGAANRLAGNL